MVQMKRFYTPSPRKLENPFREAEPEPEKPVLPPKRVLCNLV